MTSKPNRLKTNTQSMGRSLKKWAPKRLMRLLCSLSILCLFLLHASGAIHLSLLDALERFSYDVKLNHSAAHTIDDRVVIIDIDEKSLQQVGQWPWNRDKIAHLINQLGQRHQARSISFDMVFAEANESEGLALLDAVGNQLPQQVREDWQQRLDYDRKFSEAIAHNPVILGYVFNQSSQEQINPLPNPITRLSPSIRKQLQLAKPKGFTSNIEALQTRTTHSGFFDNPIVDADGVYRKVPLVQQYQGGIYPSLALATVLATVEEPKVTLNIQREEGYASVEGLSIGQNYIATGMLTDVYVPYRGRQESYPYLSAVDVMDSTDPINTLNGRIAIIGTSAPGLLDLRSTPLQKNYPGVEVHANLITGILDGTTRYRPSYSLAIEFITLLLVGCLIIFSPFMNSPFKHLSLLITLGLIHLCVNVYLWSNGLVLNLASPLILIFTLLAFQTSWGFFIESRAKRHLARLFSQYIPKELVSRMAEAPESFELNGESREMTVLFTDIRSFTNISESLEPKELSQLMNEYLTPMTEIIHKHNGTIDKYMGDAIMAFWGAPLHDERHRYNAIHAAEEMLEALDKLNKKFKQRGWPRIEIGIGINTGMMDVGNMGSEYRMAYTVLGDAVNLGSRLEGLTKNYGVYTIIGEETKKAVPDFLCREIDRVKVKGKDRPVSIYEPIGHQELMSPDEVEQTLKFNEMLLRYRAQDWAGCIEILKQLINDSGPHPLFKVYLERIRSYQKVPPDSDWDGVFVHTTK